MNQIKDISPNEFRQKIADMSPLFKNIGVNETKDLVNFIIMILHEELNQSIDGNNFVQQNNFICSNQNRIFISSILSILSKSF